MRCSKIDIPEHVCYIGFGKHKSVTTIMIGTTCRGEDVYVDFDHNDCIVGIELVNSDKKPCQKPDKI